METVRPGTSYLWGLTFDMSGGRRQRSLPNDVRSMEWLERTADTSRLAQATTSVFPP
jgi:hypothetical protein